MSASAGTGGGFTDFKSGAALPNEPGSAVGGNNATSADPAGGGLPAGGMKGGKHFKKGSKAAKEFMARLRAMRGKTSKGGKKRRCNKSKKMNGGEPEPEEEGKKVGGNGDNGAGSTAPVFVEGDGKSKDSKPEESDIEKEMQQSNPATVGGRRRNPPNTSRNTRVVRNQENARAKRESSWDCGKYRRID